MKTFKVYLEESITRKILNDIEKFLDGVFKSVKIDIEFTKHFFERVNNKRNKKSITREELINLYMAEFEKYKDEFIKYKDNFEAVLNDISTDINIPFVLKWNKKTDMVELVAKTIMRKKDFKTSNKKYKVKTQ
jgi:hypothetical protein